MSSEFSRRFTQAEIEEMRRLAADETNLGRSVLRMIARFAASLPFAEDVVAAWHCARDPQTPASVRLVLMSALAYFVLPIDAVPDIIPLLGFGDDAAVIATAIATVAGALKPEHREQARETIKSL